MKLKLQSAHDDILELEIGNITPQLNMGEISVGGDSMIWHACWSNMIIKEFKEDLETVKKKVIDFYNAESKNSKKGEVFVRKPGKAELSTEYEKFELLKCKPMNFKVLSNGSAYLELNFDGCKYFNFKNNVENN